MHSTWHALLQDAEAATATPSRIAGTPTHERGDARGRDGRSRQELAAGMSGAGQAE
jgi:hypothetical protein